MITAVRCMSMLSRANIARLSVAALIVTTAKGQTWNGAGANNLWSNGLASGNWTAAAAPVNNGTANVAFGGSTRLTPDMDASWGIASLTFNSGAGNFVLGSTGAFTLSVQNITNNSSSTETINNALVCGGQLSASNGALVLGGTVSGGFSTLGVTGTFNTTISNVLSNATLNKSGTGTLTLSNTANTYAGQTGISAGTVSVTKLANGGSNSSLGAPTGFNATIFLGSGTLSYTGGTDSTDRNFQISGSGTIQATAAGTLTLAGTIVFVNSVPLTFDTNTGSNITVAVGITEGSVDGSLTKTGPGTLTLSTPNNSYTGQTTISAGTVSVTKLANGGSNSSLGAPTGSNATILLGSATAATLSYTGGTDSTDRAITINGAGGGTIQATVAGTLTLTGGINNSGNPLSFDTNMGNITETGVISGGGSLTKTGPGTLTLSNANSYTGATTINGGTVADGAANALPTGTTLTVSSATFDLNGNNQQVGAISGTGAATNSSATAVTFTVNNSASDTSANVISGNLSLTKTGAGTLTLTGTSNSYTGATTVNGGTLADGALNALPIGTSLIVNPGATFNLSGNNQQVAAVTGIGTVTNSSGTAANFTLNNTTNYTTNNAITGNLSLIKTGTGTLFPGIWTYTGTTTINGGTIAGNSGGSNPLPAGTALTVNSGGTFDLEGNNQLVGGITGSGTVTNFSGTAAIFTVSNSGSDSASTSITGNLSLIKNSGGTLTLSGANSFSGGLTLNAGTLAVGNNAAVGTGTLTLNGGAIQADTSPQTLANAVSILANTTFGGSLDLTLSGSVTVTGTRTLTVNNAGATTFSGTVNLAGGNSLTEVGTGALTFSQPNTLAGSFNLNAGTFNAPNNVTFSNTATFTQNAGTFTGTLINQGSFVYNGGTFSGQLNNQGSATFNQDFVAGNGLINFVSMSIAAGHTLTLNGAGLDNEGTFTLAGTLTGNGPLVNNSSITGAGTIAGSGGFTNNATLTASGGNFTLSNSGTNTNNGTITLPNGFQFRVTGTTLNNNGTINLNSATLAGTGTLANLAAGVVDGPGTISTATFTNSGIVQPGKGTLNILNAWTNNGALQLTDFTSNVTGGTITNAGQIQGQGSIGAPLVNNATIAPSGGTLNIGGTFQNSASGLVRVSSGNTLAALNGLATNAGIINLTGGTLDNNGHALNNTGQVSGYGTLSTGGLTNNGSVTLTGGTTTVNGDVTNASSKTVRILYNPAIFTGNVTNNGTFKTTSTTATFAGTFTNNGTFSSDPATQYFQDLKVGATGALQGGVGDLFVINGDLTNNSTQNSAFNISGAQLTLANGAHSVTWSGVDLGAGGSGFNNNFAIGIFELGPQAILQMLGGALYVHEFRLDGGLSELASISDSHNIYYDANDPANAYLNDKTYSLNGGGFLLPASGLGVVPEPGTTALLMLGALAVGIYAWRRSRA